MAGFATQTREFLVEVRDQMEKVTWPDWPQLKNSTFVIVVFVLIVSATIFVMDLGVSNILRVITEILGG